MQALVLLNDPQVLEAARVLAEKLSIEKLSDKEKVEKAFRLIVCRKAKTSEAEILNTYFEDEKKKFQQSPVKAADFLKAGEYGHEKISDKTSAAALMRVVHAIYNMEESITK